MDLPLVNILVRTHKMPVYFEKCISSIDEQTYENINILIGIEKGDFETFDYVQQTILKYNKKNYSKIIFYEKQNSYIKAPNSLLYGNWFPYNKYLDILSRNVSEGFIIYLDDDDKLISQFAVEKMISNIKSKNDLIIWRVSVKDKLIPDDIHWQKLINGKNPEYSNISGISFCFHSKFVNNIQWGYWAGGDFRVISKLYSICKKKRFINEALTGAQDAPHSTGINIIRKKMKILFLYPSLISGWASLKEHGSNESSYIDHGLAMLSAVLKNAGHNCFLMDLRSFQDWGHFESVLKQQDFDFTITGFFSANERFARQAVEIVKRNFPNKYIIGGGVHLSVTQTREYPNIDTIVLGEGEPHILNIAEIIANGGKPDPVYDLKMVENFDSLPYVDRGLFNPRMEETSPLLPGLPEPFITIVAGRGCPYLCTFCLDGDTLVMMSDLSHKKIKNVKIGDIVVGLKKRLFNHGDKKVSGFDPIGTKVLNVMSRIADVFEITTNKGSIITTGEHPFLTAGGRWRNAKFFRVDDMIRYFCNPNNFDTETIDYKHGYISGVLYGDGYIGHTQRKERKIGSLKHIMQIVGDDEMIDRFHDYSISLGFKKTHYAKFNGGKIYYNVNRCVRNNTKSEIEIYEKIKYKKNETLEYKRGFLAGFFDADGSNAITGKRTNIRFHNLNKDILQKTAEYLDEFNISYKWEKTGIRISGGSCENNTFISIIKPARFLLRRIRLGKEYAVVDSIKRIGKRKVYNLTTGTENFIANGLITHNCSPSRSLINGNKCRVRSVDHFLGEIIELNKRPGGIGSIMIHDDLLGSKKWIEEFISKWNANLPRIPFWCQMRADSVLRIKDYIPALSDIGMSYVSLGLESGSQRMLDFLHKGTTVKQNIEACHLLHDNEINIFANYIVALPGETPDDLDETEKMLKEIKPKYQSASVYTSYPGSALYNYIQEFDLWLEPEEHYSTIRYPYERKLKGVDYDYIYKRIGEWIKNYTGELREYTRKKT